MPSLVPSPERKLLFRQMMGSTTIPKHHSPKQMFKPNGGTPPSKSVVSTTTSKQPPGQKPGGQEMTRAKHNNHAPTTAAKGSFVVPDSSSGSTSSSNSHQKAGDSPGEPKQHAATSRSRRSKTSSSNSRSEEKKPSKAHESRNSTETIPGTKKKMADDSVVPKPTKQKKNPNTMKKRSAAELGTSVQDRSSKKARVDDTDEVSSLSSTKRRSANKRKVQDIAEVTLDKSVPSRDTLRRWYGWDWKYGKLEIIYFPRSLIVADIAKSVIYKWGKEGHDFFEGWDSLVKMWNDPDMGETWAPQPTASMKDAMKKLRMSSRHNIVSGTSSSSSVGQDIGEDESIKPKLSKAAASKDDPILQTVTKLNKTLDTKKKGAAPKVGGSEEGDIRNKKAVPDAVKSLTSTKRRSIRSATKQKGEDTVDLTEPSTNTGTSVPSRTELRLWYGWKWKYGQFGDIYFPKSLVEMGIYKSIIQKYGVKGTHYFEGREALEKMWNDPDMGATWAPQPTESMKQAMKKKNVASNLNMTEISASKNGSGTANETKRQTVVVKTEAAETTNKTQSGAGEHEAALSPQQQQQQAPSDSSKAETGKDTTLQKGDSSSSTIRVVVVPTEITPDKPSTTLTAEILAAKDKSAPHKETTSQKGNVSATSIPLTAKRNRNEPKDLPCKKTNIVNTRNRTKVANEIIPKTSTYSLFILPKGNVSAPANGAVANEITPMKSKPTMAAAPPTATHGNCGASEMEQKPPSFKAEIASVEAQCGVEPKAEMNLRARVQQLEQVVLGFEKSDYVKKRLDSVCAQLPEMISCMKKLEWQVEIGNNNINLLTRTMNIERKLGVKCQQPHLKARLSECTNTYLSIYHRMEKISLHLRVPQPKKKRTIFDCLQSIENELGLDSRSSSSPSVTIMSRLDECEKTLPKVAARIRHLECRIEIEVASGSGMLQRVKKLEDEIGCSCDEPHLKARLDECYKNCS